MSDGQKGCPCAKKIGKQCLRGIPAMFDKSVVLRKKGHWYVLNSRTGDEREIILALMEYAEQEKYDISKEEVYQLMEKLGWKLEVYIPGLGAA